MKRLLKLVAIATVAAAWNPFGRRKAQDATTTTTTTPGTCDASDEACAAAAEADALERLAALEMAASVPAGAGRPSTAPQKWISVAVSANGSRRVALASGGTFANDFKGAGLWTSRDGGATWQQKARDGNWRSVASDAAGDRLLACGAGRAPGELWRSRDAGETWAAVAGGPSGFWDGAASSADGSALAAVDGANPGRLWLSRDAGDTWAPVPGDHFRREQRVSLKAAALSDTGSTIAVALWGGHPATSDDGGRTWITSTAPALQWSAVAVSSDGSTMALAAYGGGVWTSADAGATWAERAPSGEARSWIAVACDGTCATIAAASSALLGDSTIWLSRDGGATWADLGIPDKWTGLALSADGAQLAAVAKDATAPHHTPLA